MDLNLARLCDVEIDLISMELFNSNISACNTLGSKPN